MSSISVMNPSASFRPVPISIAGLVLGVLLGTGLAPLGAAIDPHPRPQYTVFRASRPITIDGKLDEAAWFAAPSLGDFAFPWWKEGRKEQTCAKLLWDDEYLYLAVVCEDAHITARHIERDGRIQEDDCVELMLAPNAEQPRVYFNIEFNVLGGIVDNFRPNGPDKPRAPKWDAEGVRIAGTWRGTPNDDSDADESWQVEIAIPWRNFAGYAKSVPPQAGTVMFLNVNRHGGKTNPQYSQWAAGDGPKPSFHTPDRFGAVTLSNQTAPFPRYPAPREE